MRKLLCAIGIFGLIAQANAEGLNTNNIYFGGGLNNNDLSGYDSANGYQFFAGYPLDAKFANGTLAVEAGYMDSGDFERTVSIPPFFSVTAKTEATGLWGTAVGNWRLDEKTSLIGRLGLDIGDDDGLMFGFGLGYGLNNNLELRGEYVLRDNVDSLQVNVVFRQ